MLKDLTKTYKALADSNRIRIVKMLQAKPMCVCELTKALGLAVSTVSKHLSILREAGLIEDVKDGRWVEYRLAENGGEYSKIQLKALKALLESDPTVTEDICNASKISREDICS
jgi:ArsR family transcriptional regulator